MERVAYLSDRRPRRRRHASSRFVRTPSPSSSATNGQQNDDAYYDAEFDHTFDEEDAALNLRYRQEDRNRVSKHGEKMAAGTGVGEHEIT
jgi:hypothetical protein